MTRPGLLALPWTLALALLSILTLQAGEAEAVAAKNGVRPLAPKPGAVVPVGGTVPFKAAVRGRGGVYMHVCTSRKRAWNGMLCKDAHIEIMWRKGRRGKARLYTATPTAYTFPNYWLNTPRVYYWQAVRIGLPCKRRGRRSDCVHESRVVKFRVG